MSSCSHGLAQIALLAERQGEAPLLHSRSFCGVHVKMLSPSACSVQLLALHQPGGGGGGGGGGAGGRGGQATVFFDDSCLRQSRSTSDRQVPFL